MARKKKAQECPAGEKWAVPYADFLSLLLALFIALYAISSVNKAKTTALKTEIIKIFDFPDSKGVKKSAKTSEAKKNAKAENLSSAIISIDSITNKQNKNNERYNIALDQAENQIAIDMPASINFEQGSDKITSEDNLNFVKIVSKIISSLPNSVGVELRGFADDFASYIDNYELSSKRSFNVLRLLIKNGVNPDRLRYSAFGENHIIGVNNLKSVKIYFRIDRKNREVQKSVLDAINGME